MPSRISRYMRRQIRLIRPLIYKVSITTARTFQDKLGELESRMVASKVKHTEVGMENFKACFVEPKRAAKPDDRVLLYFHGGGYVSGNLKYACGFAGMLAASTNRRVFSAAYRLAPEHPFPAAVDDALASYKYLLDQGIAPKDICLVGESAGGGLIFALCLLLKEKQLPLPQALVGVSPWTDLTFQGESYKTNAEKDPSLDEAALRNYAEAYAGGQQANPLVSPVYGDLAGFPPSLIIAGGDELLLDDAKMLHEGLINAGSKSELIVEDGLWHVYVLFKIPEANVAIKKIAKFLESPNQ